MKPRAAWALAFWTLRRTLRRKDALIWMFLMPLPFAWVFGVAFRERSAPPPAVHLQSPAGDPLAGRLAGILVQEGWTLVEGESEYRVEIPPGVVEALRGGRPVEVKVVAEGSRGRALQVLVYRALLRLRAHLLAALTAPGDETAPSPVALEVSSWKGLRPIPSGFLQSVPGNLVQFLMMALLVTAAATLASDMQAGLLRREVSCALAPVTVVAGRAAAVFLWGMVEALYLLGLSVLVFKISFPPPAVVVVFLLAFTASGMGVLLAVLVRRPGPAAGLGLLLTLALAALGGCWWPLEIVPASMRRWALWLPTGRAMAALGDILVGNGGWAEARAAAPYFLLLGTLFLLLGGWRLRRRLS